MTTHRARAVLGSAALAWTLALPAGAQDLLVANGHYLSASRFGDDLGLAPAQGVGQPIGGERYAVVNGQIIDRRTGQGVTLPPFVSLLATDPVRPRVFLRAPGSTFALISVFAASGASTPFTIVGGRQAPTAAHASYAASADRLFVDVADTLFAPPNDLMTHDVQVFDGATGQQLGGGFSFQSLPNPVWMVTPDARTAFVAEPGGLTVIDVASGTRRVVPQPATSLTWDDLNERLLVGIGASIGVVTRDGVLLGTAGMGTCFAAAVSPHTGRLYVRRYQQSTYGSLNDLRVFDSRTYAQLGQVSFPFLNDCTLTVASAPGAPRDLGAVVANATVTLSWTNVGAASHFVLDVGLAAGRTDLSVFLGPASHASFAGVPSGAYYLRLRGGNEVGGGRPSAEVRVVVP